MQKNATQENPRRLASNADIAVRLAGLALVATLASGCEAPINAQEPTAPAPTPGATSEETQPQLILKPVDQNRRKVIEYKGQEYPDTTIALEQFRQDVDWTKPLNPKTAQLLADLGIRPAKIDDVAVLFTFNGQLVPVTGGSTEFDNVNSGHWWGIFNSLPEEGVAPDATTASPMSATIDADGNLQYEGLPFKITVLDYTAAPPQHAARFNNTLLDGDSLATVYLKDGSQFSFILENFRRSSLAIVGINEELNKRGLAIKDVETATVAPFQLGAPVELDAQQETVESPK